MGFIQNLLEGTASAATQGFLGIGLGAINDQRQLNQQQHLQDIQIAGQKEMTDYNMTKQLEMWKETSYPGQMEMLKKAGLNPALLYGMGGGGGQTTGNASGNVTGGQANQNPGEAVQMMGIGLQAQNMEAQRDVLKAQKENIDADTANKQAENPNIPKTGKLIETQTASLSQGIKNQQAAEKYTEVQTELAEIQKDIQGSEINDLKATIKYGMRSIYQNLRSETVTANVDEATQQTKIGIIKYELANSILNTYLTKAKTENVKQDTWLKIEQMKNLYAERSKGWDSLSNETQRTRLQSDITDYQTTLPPEIKELLDNIFIVPNLGGTPKRNPIGYK